MGLWPERENGTESPEEQYTVGRHHRIDPEEDMTEVVRLEPGWLERYEEERARQRDSPVFQVTVRKEIRVRPCGCQCEFHPLPTDIPEGI